jgi:hypothetical protein
MGWWAALGGGAFVLASFLVSVRLLALAWRTRELPELLVGTNLALSGVLGYPIAMAAKVAPSAELQTRLVVLHALMMIVGQSSVVVFNWRVFRPAEAWALRLAVAYPILLAALFAWQTASPGWAELASHGAGAWRVLPYFTLFGLAWAATESLLFHAKLRRRLSLGLADPVTTDRLRLWAIAMISAFAITATSLLLRELGVPMTPMLSAVVVGPLGLLAATAMWLAFLSPRRYRSWVAARIASART